MRYIIAFALFLTGCSESATELTAWQKAMRDGSVDVVAKQDETLEILKGNTASLTAIKTQIESLEASLVDSKSVRRDGDPASAPNPPAKANTQKAPLKVATPEASRITSDGTRLRWNIEGNWNPTILQTSAHLREHGINTDGMTHQEMADLHAAIHEGKPVAAKSESVRYVSRGTSCPNGQCPTTSTRYVRRSRR
jgi:acylphosphatase